VSSYRRRPGRGASEVQAEVGQRLQLQVLLLRRLLLLPAGGLLLSVLLGLLLALLRQGVRVLRIRVRVCMRKPSAHTRCP
jgi:hypothetical protein